MATTLKWTTPPSHIARNLSKRTSAIESALNALAQNHASRGESTMKQNAPWQDRTGNARGSLFGQAEGTTIILGGTVSYIIYLELGTSKMSARPVIVPTANEAAPDYFEDAATLVGRLLGGGS